jgi:hypothetical protein
VKPVVATADLAMTQDELEAQRQQILQEANEIIHARQELDITFREYNIAHGFTLVNNEPGRVGDVRNRGRNLNKELNRLKYSTLAKNLRAA